MLGVFAALAGGSAPATVYAGPANGEDGAVVRLAAASGLRFAVEELIAEYTSERNVEIRATYGASGSLARQIERGAPFQIFLSASRRDADYVLKADPHAEDEVLGRGSLALYLPEDGPIQPSGNGHPAAVLRGAVQSGVLERLALANPQHAPYGRAAVAWLAHEGLLEAVETHFVLGESAAQAARFASSGSVQAGLIPAAYMQVDAVADRGRFLRIDPAAHPSLDHRRVLLFGAGSEARSFYEWLGGDAARERLHGHGMRFE